MIDLARLLDDTDYRTATIGSLLEADGAGETLSVILRIPSLDATFKRLQKAAAEVIPDLRDFESEYHVTLAYAGGMTLDALLAAVPEVKEALFGQSFYLRLGPAASLVNQKGEGVLYLRVEDEGLAALHWRLRAILSKRGGRFTFPHFKGHMTLAYRDTPIDAAALEQINQLPTMFDVRTSTSDFKITRKNGEAWERLG